MARKTFRRKLWRVTFITVNVVLFSGIVLFMMHSRSSGSANAIHVLSDSPKAAPANPLDQMSSADIALTVSQMTGLSESTAIQNRAVSDDANLAAAPVTNNVVSLPQVTSTTLKSNKDIQTYTVAAGDTVSSVAARFKVTSDSIRWSNGISGDSLNTGAKIQIPPVGYSGIVYTVKAGDTLASLSQKYKADLNELTAANDAEIDGIHVGEQIIIPNGQQPVVVQTTYGTSSSAYSTSGLAWGTTAQYSGNGYYLGYCTWWVAERRIQVGNPLPSNLGNASTWPYYAAKAGLATGSTPRQYAAAVTSLRGEGHVVFVEAVNDDGSILISEMNHVGWNVRDTQTIPADVASSYIYIY